MTFGKGQSLIEVIIAFAITVILGVGLISASLVTQRATLSARNNTQASKLAEEYIEQVRVIRDVRGYAYLNNFVGCNTITASGSDPSSWVLSNFSSTVPVGGCEANLKDGTPNSKITLNKVDFYRDVEIPTNGINNTRVIKVTVAWDEGVNVRTVKLQTSLSSWCEGQITSAPGAVCPP